MTANTNVDANGSNTAIEGTTNAGAATTVANADAANAGTTANADAANAGTTANADAANAGTANADAANAGTADADAANAGTTANMTYPELENLLGLHNDQKKMSLLYDLYVTHEVSTEDLYSFVYMFPDASVADYTHAYDIVNHLN
jgi:hypothetical protein